MRIYRSLTCTTDAPDASKMVRRAKAARLTMGKFSSATRLISRAMITPQHYVPLNRHGNSPIYRKDRRAIAAQPPPRNKSAALTK